MRILVNARPLSSIFTGVARYLRTLYGTIDEMELAKTIYMSGNYHGPDMPLQSDIVSGSSLPQSVRGLARRVQLSITGRKISGIIRNDAADIYHETGLFPHASNSPVPQVITIHDMSIIRYPEYHPLDRVKYFQKHIGHRLPLTDHILTVSEFSRQEVIATLSVDPAKVTAIPLAASEYFYLRSNEEIAEVLAACEIPREYLLTVGTLEPRKNHQGLLQALTHLKSDIPLVCVGWSGWLNGEFRKQLSELGLTDQIIELGHIPDYQLAALYSGARAMVYPSFYEGFGLPVLEAMASGCPVICSNTSSLPEVAGDGAILVHPDDIEGMAEAIEQVLTDEELRASMIHRGRMQARKFDWRDTATKTIELFQELTGNAAEDTKTLNLFQQS